MAAILAVGGFEYRSQHNRLISLSLSLSPGPWWRVVALHRALVPPPLLQLNKQGNIHPNSCSIYTHPATITKAKWLMR